MTARLRSAPTWSSLRCGQQGLPERLLVWPRDGSAAVPLEVVRRWAVDEGGTVLLPVALPGCWAAAQAVSCDGLGRRCSGAGGSRVVQRLRACRIPAAITTGSMRFARMAIGAVARITWGNERRHSRIVVTRWQTADLDGPSSFSRCWVCVHRVGVTALLLSTTGRLVEVALQLRDRRDRSGCRQGWESGPGTETACLRQQKGPAASLRAP